MTQNRVREEEKREREEKTGEFNSSAESRLSASLVIVVLLNAHQAGNLNTLG